MPGLDGMRAIAVVTVMIYHANSTWLKGGFLGVEVFFVISGYLITLLLISEHERDHTVDMKQFWIRRARRLLPALFVMLFLLTIWTALFERSTLGKLRGDIIAALAYGSNWYQVYTGQGYAAANDFAPLRHLWSLAVEEQFYLIWPIVMVLLLRVGSRGIANLSRWLVAAAIGITVLVALLYHQGPIGTPQVTPEAYWNIFGRNIAKADTLYLSTFTPPVACCSVPRSPWSGGRSPSCGARCATGLPVLDGVGAAGLVVLGLMMWTVGFMGANGADALLFRGGFFLSAIATLAVIAATTHPLTMTSRALALPPLVWLGQRSYGLYLYHWPIYQLIRNIAGKQMKLHEFAIAMGITIVITELSYRYIETPIRKGALGRWRKQMRETRDPGRRNAVLAGAFVGTVLAIFGVTSLATAELKQNDVQASIEEGGQFTCDVLADPTCTGGTTAVPTGSDPATESTPVTTADPLVDPTQSTVDPTTTIETTTTSTIPVPIPMLALGDSVMKGAASPITALGFTVDAEESRQFVDGVEVAEALKEQGRLGDVVLIHLGTNGTIGTESMQRMMTALADVPRVMILTNDVDKEWTQGNNQLLYDIEATYPNVQLVDWLGLNDACVDDCFASDGLHMNANGADFYANVINEFLQMPM